MSSSPVAMVRRPPDAEAIALLSALVPGVRRARAMSTSAGGEEEDSCVGVSLTAAGRSGVLHCEIRRVGRPGIYAIESALSRAAIWMRSGGTGANAVVVVVPELGVRLIGQVEASLATIAGALRLENVAVLSRQGGGLLRLRSWLLERTQADPASPALEGRVSAPGSTPLSFSEANQQLLKVLLYHTLRTKAATPDIRALVAGWSVHSPHELLTIDDWASACDVGRATAFRLYRVMRAERLVGETKHGVPLQLTDPRRLLERWLQAELLEPPRLLLPVRPLYPPKGSSSRPSGIRTLTWLHELDVTARAAGSVLALTGWHAAKAFDALIVTGDLPITAVVPLQQHLDALLADGGLCSCPPHEAWAFLGVARPWRAVFAGVRDGGDRQVAIVDLWQVALDVVGDPGRGREQAEAILRRLCQTVDR